jgi:hypothetical protein
LLIKEFAKAAPETREVLLGILAMTRGEESLAFLVQCIKDETESQTAEVAARILLDALRDLDDGGESATEASAQQKEARQAEIEGLRKHLLGVIKRLGKKTSDETHARLLRLLVEVADDSCKSVFLSATGVSRGPELRCEGLRGLATGVHLTPAEIKKLLAFLKESDFLHIVGPTLEVLKDAEFSGAPAATALAALLDNQRPEVRLFAIQKLGAFPTATSAKLLLPFLDSEDERVRSLTSHSLGANPAAVDALVKKLFAARDLEEASRPLDALVLLAAELKPAQLRKMAQRFLQLLHAEDPVRESYQRVLAAAPTEKSIPVLLKEAVKLRKDGELVQALSLLEILPTSVEPMLDADLHYERALLMLLLRGADPENNEGDPVLGLFRVLLDADFDLLTKLKKETQLEAGQFLYIGERFLQHLNQERRFGTELLRWLIENDADSKAAVQAVQKLKLEGLI